MRKRFRLNDEHPTHKKLQRVFDCMDKEGIRIDVQRDGTFLVMEKNDTYQWDTVYELMDAEGGPVGCLSPVFEYKLVYEKEVKDE